jgi:predicted nuclease of restriction endonuclease-like (RecB) superfamily
VVDRLAADLRAEFPNSRGFSSANLRYMRGFAAAWPDPAILQRVVGKLPWSQNIALLAVKDPDARLWYAEAALEHGWSRPVLAAQIDTKAHARQGKALTNFARVLPPEISDLAQQVLKDPYQLAPDLQLQPRLREPNPIFARGELRRLAIDMLREAGKPLSIRDMALGALRAKGIRFPDRRTMKQTRVRLREVFARLRDRGVARAVGTGKATKRTLVGAVLHSPSVSEVGGVGVLIRHT